MDYDLKTFTPVTDSTDYRGFKQSEAVTTTIKRYLALEDTCSIYAHPRFGKTGVQQIIAYELVQANKTVAALSLSPMVYLANALCNTKKIDELHEYHDLNWPTPFVPSRVNAITEDMHEVQGDRVHLLSTTIQTAVRSMNALGKDQRDESRIAKWVDRCMLGIDQDLKRRPIIFADEAQFFGDQKEFGIFADLVIAHGAFLVTLTGTPYRSDKLHIPGFRYETESISEPKSRSKFIRRDELDPDSVWLQPVLRRTIVEKVSGNVEASLSDAWERNIISHVTHKEIKIYALDTPAKGGAPERKDISGAAKTSVTKSLRDFLAENRTIEEGVALAVEDIIARRNGDLKNAACIVFAMSDIDPTNKNISDGATNWHSRKIKRAFLAEASRRGFPLKIQIATMASEVEDGSGKSNRANNYIREFVEDGKYDVLILKAMGGVGLDVYRVKTLLDLSTIREPAPVIQRWMRAATRKESIPATSVFTLITPNDPASRDIYRGYIKDQGGDRADLKQQKTREELDGEAFLKESDPDPKINLKFDSAERGEVTTNTKGAASLDAEAQAIVTKLRAGYPEYDPGSIPDGMLYKLYIDGVLQMREAPKPKSRDIDAECAALRSEINNLADDITHALVEYRVEDKSWGRKRAEIMARAKEQGRCYKKLELEKSTSVLTIIRDHLIREIQNLGKSNAA